MLRTRPYLAVLFAVGLSITACSGSAPLSPSKDSNSETPPAGGLSGSSATAPVITQQPEHQSIGTGQTVQLTVRVTGTEPMNYQWYRGVSGQTTTVMSGATGRDFVTPALATTSSFWVRVSNAAGSVDSSAATVTVSSTPPPSAVAPSITSQPDNQSVTSGQSVTLNVGAAGTVPLLFQWYAGVSGDAATPISGATASSLTISPSSTSSYWVRVSNSAGNVNSTTATVTVLAPPPPPSGSSPLEDQVLVLINQRRASGTTCGGTPYPAVSPLALDLHLRDAARGHSQDMAVQNYFSHTSLDGRTFDQRIWQSGYTGGFPLGENIAAGATSAQAVVDSWMASTGHCQNIMNGSFHAIGIGYAFTQSSTYKHYWTQSFGGG